VPNGNDLCAAVIITSIEHLPRCGAVSSKFIVVPRRAHHLISIDGVVRQARKSVNATRSFIVISPLVVRTRAPTYGE
jgi:hypothetical protein